MKSVRIFGLGIKLALSGGRSGLLRILLMSVGLALGVALLLGALGIQPAIHAHDRREAARSVSAPYNPRSIHDATLEWLASTAFRDQSVLLIAVKPVGRAPVPPGLPRLPRAGEVFESPALARLLESPGGTLLRPRIQGTRIGAISPEGLLEPNELVAYVGASPAMGLRHADAEVFTSFGQSQPAPVFDIGTVLMLVVIVITFAIPIALFLLTITRLSTATRETRLAAVRLAGGTQLQVRALAAAESGLAAVVGCAVGIPTFLLARRIVAALSIPGYRLFPSDLTPSPYAAAAILIGVPAFAVGVSVLSMRRVMISPLGVVRRARRVRRGWLWPVLLVSGVAGLWLSALGRVRLMAEPSPIPGLVIGAGLALALAGLAGTTPWIAWRISSAIATRGPRPSVLLGARRLEADPTSSGRIASGVGVLVAIVAVAQAVLLSSNSTISIPAGVAALRPSQVIVNAYARPESLPALSNVPGVRSLLIGRHSPEGGVTCRCIATIETDGNPDTVERIRNALGWHASSVNTAAELRTEWAFGSVESRWVRLLELAILLLLLVTGGSTLVSTVDGLMERRRSLAALSAIGVPASVLRRSVLLQVALPLLSGLVLGAVSGLLTSAFVLQIGNEPVHLPIGTLLVTAAAVAGVVVLVTAGALPWVRVARRPELLRTE